LTRFAAAGRVARSGALALAVALATCHAPPSALDPGFVSVAEVAPGIELDMRYAGPDNFVGAPIEGYERPTCLLTEPAARALAAVQRDLAAEGLGLRVFDCYRPQRAVAHFARWARDAGEERTKAAYYPRVEKSALFAEGYVAERSGHSRGSTVDLTLVALRMSEAGEPLDMGTPFDLFDPRSNTDSPEVGPAERARRHLLRDAMARRGFRPYPLEWWHFTLAAEPYPDSYFDVPVR
jgi:D-alanyl-D-alanine dipeptidase